jgi:hypothetical protein
MPASTVFCALRPLVNRYIALADHIIRTNPASLLSLIGRLIRSRFRSWEWGCKRKRLCGIFRMLALHAVPTSCPNTYAISQLPQPLAARRISAACWSSREERIGSQPVITSRTGIFLRSRSYPRRLSPISLPVPPKCGFDPLDRGSAVNQRYSCRWRDRWRRRRRNAETAAQPPVQL